MRRDRRAERDPLILDQDVEGVGVDAEPGRDVVARHRRDFAWLAWLRGDVELRDADEERSPSGSTRGR